MHSLREKSGELVVLRCWCGIQHAVPKSLRDVQMRQHNDGRRDVQVIHCPLGHAHVPKGETASERLERQLARERAAHDQTRADRDYKERRRRAEKAAKTRLKNRAAAGLCPCCNRTFQNLARHMKGQHPEFAKGEAS